ncbi:hypothetical protein ACHAW5_009265 [Stephanodiscus triporus]|uniref:L domain-like protein n=1 Tax=Stephanodiscus triporus TaxID=2934178 RepID=A0ABD3N256_9STRA
MPPPPRSSRRRAHRGGAVIVARRRPWSSSLATMRSAFVVVVVVVLGSSSSSSSSSSSASRASIVDEDSLIPVVHLDEESLVMAERLILKMNGRVDAPPSWNITLLPAMMSSFRRTNVDDDEVDVGTMPMREDRSRRLALRWLSNVDNSSSVLKSRRVYEAGLLQRYALATIYYATGGDGWTRCAASGGGTGSSSSSSSSPCVGGDDARFLSSGSHLGWDGVNGKDGSVNMLDLGDRGLRSSTFLPPEILLLSPSLELLWTHDNPDLGGTLPSYLGDLANLQTLAVHGTSMSGSIPGSMYSLSNLISLRLYGSRFGGEISSDIGKLASLRWLWIHDNDFVGTLPYEIGDLARLEGVTLHGNGFLSVAEYNVDRYGVLSSNIIPDSLCNLTDYDLRYLWTDCEMGSVILADEGEGGAVKRKGKGKEGGAKKFIVVEGTRACSCCTRCFPRKNDAAGAAAMAAVVGS